MFCALCLSACALPPQTRALHNDWPADLPQRHELGQTPFFPQTRLQCGPAALATVLATHGLEVTPDQLTAQVFTPGLEGSLAEELVATARRYGMLAYPLAPRLGDLLAEVAAGHPILVYQNLGTAWLPRRHFAVVVGYDAHAGTIILRSGTTRRWQTSLGNFERTWARGGRRAWVMVPAETVPHTATLLPYLRASRDLEQTGDPGRARAAWQAATARWPDSFHAWMALGNSHYGMQEFVQAMVAYQQATRLAPLDASGWNNLAYALFDNHCPQRALLAAQCAYRLAPDNPETAATLAELRARVPAADAAGCPDIDCPPP